MRRLVFVLLIVSLFLCGCASEVESDKISVVATLFPQYDFAKNIAGENAEVELLLGLGTDSHSYDPTPRDVMKIASADLFIYTGDSMELWAAKLLASADIARAVESGSLRVIDLSECITPICIHGHDEEHHSDADPHIWTSPKNAMAMCNLIYEGLAAVDGENSDVYGENLDGYLSRLSTLDSYIFDSVDQSRLDTVYFGGSFAFAYLFSEYGLLHESVYEGCASHSEPSAAVILDITKKIKDAGAKYIVYDTETERKIAQIIANETGVTLLRMHAVHNISKNEFESGEDYLSLMKQNADALGKALN